ncbi:hypothetical protein D3C83_283590 [compost metagenome]
MVRRLEIPGFSVSSNFTSFPESVVARLILLRTSSGVSVSAMPSSPVLDIFFVGSDSDMMRAPCAT